MNIDILLDKLAAPAKRAIINAKITSLDDLLNYSQEEIMAWHGIGKNAMKIIITTLDELNLTLK